MFEIPDLVRAIAEFLPDIRALRVSRTLDQIVCAHPEYALWRKCSAADNIYQFGTVKILDGRLDLERLDDAALGGNIPVLRHMIAAGADLTDPWVLPNACESGNLAAVKLLLAAGASEEDSVECLVICAAKYGHVHVLKYLLDAGFTVPESEYIRKSSDRQKY